MSFRQKFLDWTSKNLSFFNFYIKFGTENDKPKKLYFRRIDCIIKYLSSPISNQWKCHNHSRCSPSDNMKEVRLRFDCFYRIRKLGCHQPGIRQNEPPKTCWKQEIFPNNKDHGTIAISTWAIFYQNQFLSF